MCPKHYKNSGGKRILGFWNQMGAITSRGLTVAFLKKAQSRKQAQVVGNRRQTITPSVVLLVEALWHRARSKLTVSSER